MGSTTLFSAVFIRPEQVVRFLLCNGYSFCIFFQNDKISVFNPCFTDNFFKLHNICRRYVITPNVSLNLV